MKTIILAGGFGTRLQEETEVRPKPMVEIGGKPMLWHIMNIYAAHNFNEFVVALGYNGEYIKEYFLNFYALNNDLTVNLAKGDTLVHDGSQPDWHIDLVDTGLRTMTGGRIKRLSSWIDDSTFMMTYGDGVADIDLRALVEFHRSHGGLATVTAVRPPARFGGIEFDGDRVLKFAEKPQTQHGWINGGFFVLEPEAIDYIDGDEAVWERAPLEALASDGELYAYRHEGFWQPMDTLRDVRLLQSLWDEDEPPWRIWT